MTDYDDLIKRRVIWLDCDIDESTSNRVIAMLLFLQSQDDASPIHVVVESNGGSVPAGLAIIDTIDFVSCPVFTFCPQRAFALAAVILACGEPMHRYLGPHAKLTISAATGGLDTSSSEIDKISSLMAERLSRATKRDASLWVHAMAANTNFDAASAMEYNLADKVVDPYPHINVHLE